MSLIKRISVLALVLWLGAGNVAYASARSVCASMMNQSMGSPAMVKGEHDCCAPKSSPCQCSIKERSNDLSVPVGSQLERTELTAVTHVLTDHTPLVSKTVSSEALLFKSPPGSLQTLYCVFRI